MLAAEECRIYSEDCVRLGKGANVSMQLATILFAIAVPGSRHHPRHGPAWHRHHPRHRGRGPGPGGGFGGRLGAFARGRSEREGTSESDEPSLASERIIEHCREAGEILLPSRNEGRIWPYVGAG
jgi:hypothetical protein